MTQAEYIAQISGASKMATSKEFIALLETGREENPFILKTSSDPTTLINLAGAATGWAECLRWLKLAHVAPKKPEPRTPTGAYEDPSKNLLPTTKENQKP